MLEAGYISLSLIMTIIILLGYNAVLSKLKFTKAERNKRLVYVTIATTLWFVYAYILCQTGILADFSLPPRFPILLIFPLFIFTGVFLYRHRNSKILHAVPKSWMTYYQAFRIAIELLFIASLPYGILPYHVTFEGYNYDIIFAMTAPIIAFLAFNKKMISEKIVLAWNYFGLVVIAFIIYLFTTTAYFPSVWGAATPLLSVRVTEFAFMLVPAFLMPSAVFIHVLSIIRLTKSIEDAKNKVEIINT